MVVKSPNYGTFVNSFKFSENSENPVDRNLEVYATLYSKVTNIPSILDYALNINDYNKPTSNDGSLVSLKSTKSILDFNVLYIILRPTLIISLDQVLHSVARALVNVLSGKPVSSNFTTEVAFMLSGSSNIGKSIDHVLLSRNDKYGSVLIVSLLQNKTKESILDMVEGVQDDLSNLNQYTKVDEIIKEFKITEPELSLPGGLEAGILGRIGVKRI